MNAVTRTTIMNSPGPTLISSYFIVIVVCLLTQIYTLPIRSSSFFKDMSSLLTHTHYIITFFQEQIDSSDGSVGRSVSFKDPDDEIFGRITIL